MNDPDHGFSLDPRHVRGDLFTEHGKWKYTVVLDYTDGDWNNWDLHKEAEDALARATENGLSGVTIKKLSSYYRLVVLSPYSKHSYPITVVGKD